METISNRFNPFWKNAIEQKTCLCELLLRGLILLQAMKHLVWSLFIRMAGDLEQQHVIVVMTVNKSIMY